MAMVIAGDTRLSDGLPIHDWYLSCRQFVADRKAVTNGLDTLNAGKLLEQ